MKKNFFYSAIFLLVLITGASPCRAATPVSFAILPLETAGDVSAADKENAEQAFYETLITSGKYNIVERSKTEQVLAEQGFQLTGATDRNRVVQMGRIINADKLITRRLYYRERNWPAMAVGVIDVLTGRLEFSKEVSHKGYTAGNHGKFGATMILSRYPLLGEVVGKSEDTIVIDLGESHGLKTGSRVFAARRNVTYDEGGQILFEDYSRVGILEITQPGRERSQARTKQLENPDRQVQKHDLVSQDPIPQREPVISQTPLLPDIVRGRLLLEDNMEDRQYLSVMNNNGKAYRGGQLHLDMTHKNAYHAFCFYPAPFDNLKDYILEGELEFQKVEKRGSRLTIIFRGGINYKRQNSYGLFISSSGRFEIPVRTEGHIVSSIVPLQSTPLLNRGEGKNSFRIIAYGPKFDIYINDKFLTGFIDEAYGSGSIGFYAHEGSYVTIDNIKIWEASIK